MNNYKAILLALATTIGCLILWATFISITQYRADGGITGRGLFFVGVHQMTPLAAWLLTGLLSCLITVVAQRHALRSLALGLIRLDLIQMIIAALILGALLIAGPVGLAFILVYAPITYPFKL